MRIVKGVVNVVIAFFLSIAILGNFMLMIFSNTILKKDYMLGLIEENGYYEKIETDLKNGFEDYKYQSGLPDEVFENLYSVEDLKKDIRSIISNLYEGTEITNSSEIVRNRVEENINRYLSQNNIVLNQEQQENIDEFEEIMVNVYKNKVNFVSSYITNLNTSDMIKKIESVINVVKFSLLGVLVFFVVCALLLNLKTIELFASVIGTALLASGTVLELLKLVVYRHVDIQHILLFTQSLSDLIKYIVEQIFSKIQMYGIAFIVIGIILILVNVYKKIKSEIREYKK